MSLPLISFLFYYILSRYFLQRNRCKCSNNQSLSHFLSNSPWRSADLLKSVRTNAIQTIGKNGVLILDESGIKKSGNSSVGVSHQYCGNLRKKDNCQVGVFLAYFKKKRRMLIDERLYLPQKWIEDRTRCLKAKIPHKEIKFRTKYELGLEMIDNAIEEGIPFSYVTMDRFYGENPELLTELESRGLTFVADIAVDTLVYVEKPVVEIPAKKGIRGRKPTIPRVLNTLSTRVDSLSSSIEGWKLIKVRKTERGYKKVYFKAIKVWSSICIQLLLFHNNQKNVYPHSFPVTLEFLELSCAKASKRHQKKELIYY